MSREPAERIWGGSTLLDRQAARRRRLLEAGLELLGGERTAPLAVRAVCRRAGLTERYFYESFADRDALVVAVYGVVAEEARAELAAATRAPATVPTPHVRRSSRWRG